MEYKKIGMVLIVCLLFAGVATAIGTVIIPDNDVSNKPTPNATVAETTRARENITTAVVGKGTITKEK